jgi:hypothetical protein
MSDQNKTTEKVPEKYGPVIRGMMREWQERVATGKEELRTSWRLSRQELAKLNNLTNNTEEEETP